MRSRASAFVMFFLVGLLFGLSSERCRGDEPSFSREIAVQSLAASVDLASTEWALARNPYLREGNPLGSSGALRVGLKVAQVTVVSAITVKLERRGKKGMARALRWGAVGLQVVAAGWNMRQAHAR